MDIEAIIERLLSEAEEKIPDIADFYQELSEEAPAVFDYLMNSDTDFLTDAERDYLLFVAMITVKALQLSDLVGPEDMDMDMGMIQDTEEQNWGLLDGMEPDAIVGDLEQHPAYEIYGFVADACAPDEDSEDELTAEGVNLIFVKCKSMIDVFTS